MHIKLPKGSTAYVFGSFLSSNNPRDLDILLLYDPRQCPPIDAYKSHKEFISYLQDRSGLKVDATLLTYREQKEVDFIYKSKAIEISKCAELTSCSI